MVAGKNIFQTASVCYRTEKVSPSKLKIYVTYHKQSCVLYFCTFLIMVVDYLNKISNLIIDFKVSYG